MSKKLGEYLRQLRIDQKLTIKAAAEIVGISAGFLSAIERSVYNLRNENIVYKLADLYKVNREELKLRGEQIRVEKKLNVDDFNLVFKTLSESNNFINRL